MQTNGVNLGILKIRFFEIFDFFKMKCLQPLDSTEDLEIKMCGEC